MKDLTDIKAWTMEDLVNEAVEFKQAKEELEQGLDVVRDELRDRLLAMKLTGTEVNGYYVSRMKRFSFPDVTMQEAEGLGAVKKALDTEKLKALYQKGIQIKCKVSEFINIREKKETT